MQRLRQVFLWAALVVLAALTVLTVYSAFLGAEQATALFNSIPLAVFWVALALLLFGGIVALPGLLRRGGLLAIHLGCVLILVGAMWGSRSAHQVRRDLLDSRKAYEGYLQIRAGEATRALFNAAWEVVGELPFSVRLDQLRIDTIAPEHPKWTFHAMLEFRDGESRPPEPKTAPIDWTLGEPVEVPFTDVRLRVMKYVQPAPGSAPPHLLVILPSGRLRKISPDPGREVPLEQVNLTLRVVRRFERFRIDPQTREAWDAESGPRNPAVEVELTGPDGQSRTTYAFPPHLQPAHRRPGQLRLLYYHVPPEEPPPPQVEVEVQHAGAKERHWIVPRPGAEFGGMALPVAQRWAGQDARAYLVLQKPRTRVRERKARVAVLEEGSAVQRQWIEANRPLHYGGYHFYVSHHADYPRAVLLHAVSDSGLYAVYAGFAGLWGGLAWHCWAVPLRARRRRGRTRGA